MSDKHAQIVQPCCGEDHIVVVGELFADQTGQGIEARLVPQLVDGECLGGYIRGQRFPKVAACGHVRILLRVFHSMFGPFGKFTGSGR